MDSLKKKYTNNTPEEELRELVCEQLQTINSLRIENTLLRNIVAEESEAKYKAWKKLATKN